MGTALSKRDHKKEIILAEMPAKEAFAEIAAGLSVWDIEKIPFKLRGKAVLAEFGGEKIIEMMEEYEDCEQTLPDICESYDIKINQLLQVCEQFPLIAEAMNTAEQVRARKFEGKALAPYIMDYVESADFIANYGKSGAAVAAHIKSRSSELRRSAQTADDKRYGDKNTGVVVNVGMTQNNMQTGMPGSLDELLTMDISNITEITQPSD